MSVRTTITAIFQQVASEQGRSLVPLADDVPLLQSGLDSLSFALVVARLEDTLGYDPFSSVQAVQLPVSFGEFVQLYETFPR